MRLKTLRLQNFRSYESLLLTPPEGVTVIVGENGAGKTNLLEAVHLCCLGRSHRTNDDQDMIRRGEESAAVQLFVERRDGTHDIGVRLFLNQRRKKARISLSKDMGASVGAAPSWVTMQRGGNRTHHQL